MRTFNANGTRQALPFDRLIPALRALFAAGCQVPARHVHQVPAAGGGFTSLIMPAWVDGVCYGVKTVNVAPHNARRGLPGLHSTYLLYDAATGAPLAWLDGDQITARRTAAASALAASWLARADAGHLLLVGAGQVAQLLPQAMRCVRPIVRVTVWARRAAAAEALAAQLAASGFAAASVGPTSADLASACAQADIISCATLATAPLVSGAWLQPGSHLDLIGSFTPQMREADDACFTGASVFVDTPEALAKSGDLLGAVASGAFDPATLAGTLQALARGEVPGRQTATQRTVFKSVGTALEDLAAAMLACGITLPAAA